MHYTYLDHRIKMVICWLCGLSIYSILIHKQRYTIHRPNIVPKWNCPIIPSSNTFHWCCVNRFIGDQEISVDLPIFLKLNFIPIKWNWLNTSHWPHSRYRIPHTLVPVLYSITEFVLRIIACESILMLYKAI